MSIVSPTADAIAEAVTLLRAGRLVALPTETVYGLGADALDPVAVGRIFTAKGRPADHPLIVHLPDADHLPRWASRIPKDAIALAKAFWPGPLTLILSREEDVPDAVTGGQATVGLRVPDHPVALALLRAFDSGIAAPSANRFGRISPTTAEHVQQELGDRVAMILDGGPCTVGIESTILDLSRGEPEILRPGAITADDIARVIGRRPHVRGEALSQPSGATPTPTPPAQPEAPTPPRVSGTLDAHYAPRTPLQLVDASALANRATDCVRSGNRVAVLAHMVRGPNDGRVIWIQADPEPMGYAHDLYANLRALDELGADLILVERPPDAIGWSAIADRLGRAAVGSGASDMFDET
ncbi:L-threonylcarbamoyladenylate synthase [Rhodocyclaceae bacterium SMB388]